MNEHARERRRQRRNNPVAPEQRLAVDVDGAAHLLSVSRRTIYKLITDGQLATLKIGARRLIARSEIERLLAAGAE
jgi:excisionase family DNA binding protein